MLLFDHRSRLLGKLRTVESALLRCSVHRNQWRIDRSALQEGLVSNIWQAWGNFCSEVLISSAQGAATSSGVAVTSQYSLRTKDEIKFISMLLSKGQIIRNIRAIRGSHEEPTWGDVSKINLIASGLGLSNASTLTAAFSAAQTIQDLQICRNASAHLNRAALARVRGLSTRYNSDTLFHPSDLIHWVDTRTRDFLWRSWIEEIDIISELAIQ